MKDRKLVQAEDLWIMAQIYPISENHFKDKRPVRCSEFPQEVGTSLSSDSSIVCVCYF